MSKYTGNNECLAAKILFRALSPLRHVEFMEADKRNPVSICQKYWCVTVCSLLVRLPADDEKRL